METKKVSYSSSHQTTFARYCANMVVNISRPFSLQEKNFRFSPNRWRWTRRQYTSTMVTNNVSYASSHQTTFARYCANMVVNTSRPFSLQEKHVRLWKTPSSSDQHHFFSGGISVFQFWHVLRPRTCTRTSHGCSMHRYRKWGAVVWPGEQYSSRESNNADFSKWNCPWLLFGPKR